MSDLDDVTGRNRLSGRRIVVTGAASGLGDAIARLFVRQGARLVLFDINAKVSETADALGQTGVVTDVSSEASVNAAIEQAATALGGLDGVVNAAGVLHRSTVEDTDFTLFQKIIGVNLAGPFLMCRAALPHLRKAPRATIVNIASLAGLQGFPRMGVYSASKAGLIRMSEALSGEVGPTIRINCICPGVIRTPMTEYMFEDDYDFQAEKSIQVGRPGEPLDIAQAALYLSSEESAFVAGTTLTVSGGRLS